MDLLTSTKRIAQIDTLGIHMDPLNCTQDCTHTQELTCILQFQAHKKQTQKSRISTGNVRNGRLADLTPSIFRGTFVLKNIRFHASAISHKRILCETFFRNEAFVRGFPKRLQISTCRNEAFVRPFCAARLLCCEISLLSFFFAVRLPTAEA